MGMVKCIVCEEMFKDKSPHLDGNKFCCREHWLKHLREKGSWNKGKKWDEMYNKDTLDKLKTRITATGENHHLYGIKRPDVKLNNILNNPNPKCSDKTKGVQEILNNSNTKGEMLSKVLQLLEDAVPDKKCAYQRASYEVYGEKCLICGNTKKDMQLDVHHRNEDRTDQSIKNIPPLCASCHKKLHHGVISDEQIDILVNKKLEEWSKLNYLRGGRK